MRWFRTPSKTFIHRMAIASLFAGPAFWSSVGQSAVKIISVENASTVEIPVIATAETVIYGGVAGVITGSPDPNVPFDTCANSPGTDLRPCNNRQIHTNLRLRITFVSDSTDGFNYIVTDPTRSGGTGTATLITPAADSQQTSTKGGNTTIIVTWGNICQLITGSDSACSLANQDHRSDTKLPIKIGVSKSPDGNLGTDDDAANINIMLSYWMNQDSTTGESIAQPCTDASAQGICHFEVVPGDAKVILKNLVGLNNFPTISPLTIKKIRLIYTEGTLLSKTVLNAKTPTYQDLEVSGTGTGLQVTPSRVTGLENDRTYAFKVAAVDQAGNAGYFTADEPGAQYCEYAINTQSCHITTPGEVIGALTEQMNCFIATAAFGSGMAPQVETFRNFRDRFLATTEIGRKIAKFYYKHSPKLAAAIADSAVLRAASRALLLPMLAFAWLSLKIGMAWAAFVFTLILFTPFAINFAIKRRRSRA